LPIAECQLPIVLIVNCRMPIADWE